MIIAYINSILTGTAGAMIGHNYKHCIFKPGLFRSLFKQFSQCIISILNCSCSSCTGGNINFTGRIGIGSVVGGSHYKIEERLFLFVLLIGNGQHLIKDIFITNSPCIFKSNFLIGYVMTYCLNFVA